jgi:environmental stress-induced protein Ves
MEYEVVTKKMQHADKWAGGKTTQLGIFPKHADVKKKDFIWRLSSATCKRDKSKFTDYEGYDRVLLPLEGSARIENTNADGEKRETEIQELEMLEFDGGDKTTAYGLTRDYNLIIRKDAAHYVDVIDQILAGAGENQDKSVDVGNDAKFLSIDSILKGNRVTVRLRHKKGFDRVCQAFYCADGFSSIHIEDTQLELVTREEDAPIDIKIVRLTEGEQLLVKYRADEKIKITIKGAGRLIHCQMFYNI